MKFKKMLVPVDFSHFSKKTLDTAIELAELYKSKIHFCEKISNWKSSFGMFPKKY